MDFEEFIRQDFEHFSKTTELDVAKESEDAILMQSVEGHAHNGAGMFHKRRFVNITISDIVTALELDPVQVKISPEAHRRNPSLRDLAIHDKAAGRLLNPEGEPFLSARRLKKLQ